MMWEPVPDEAWLVVPLEWVAAYWAVAVLIALWLERPVRPGPGA